MFLFHTFYSKKNGNYLYKVKFLGMISQKSDVFVKVLQ